MLEWIEKAVGFVNDYLSGYILVFLLVAVGLFYSIKTRFVQVRCLGEGFKKVFSKGDKGEKKGLSSFQALATAVAAQVGTGNIVGACGAILVGGPGAIFWMWIIAFLGMATNYAEAVLAQKTKVIDENGEIHGGPVYYIKKAFTGKAGKFLATFFAVAITIALGFIGAMVQSNSITSNVAGVFDSLGADISRFTWIIGIILAILAAAIVLGGVKRIASVTEKMVPIMALLYIVGGIFVLCVNIKNVPAAFGIIFKYAFVPQAILGGGFGSAIV
ncbi:MAG: sodium:alanine symporter family protein, partial [Clostridia bacterium]|nr:sodium:alanine symporter family protein [Clostridia bacterium]